jgi:fluoroacetyl-CoA thioesterase
LEVKLGMSGEATQIVTEQETAVKLGSGSVAAYSTPSLVSLMERASVAAIHGHMNDGQTSVGIEVSIRHLAPTPVGMHVKAHAILEEINGDHLKFKVEAWDEKERIGEGLHTRVIVDLTRFTHRLQEKTRTLKLEP